MDVVVALEVGLRETGWAVFADGQLSDTGSINCAKCQDGDASERISTVVRALDNLANTWRPREIVFKEPFRNQWPAPALDELKAALSAWAQRHNLPVHLYTPREVRAGIVGKANAPKEALAYAVMKRQGLVGVAKSTAEWEAVAAGDYHMLCRSLG